MKDIIPAVLVAFDSVEAIVCLFCSDWPRALYWFAAGLITLASILMGR